MKNLKRMKTRMDINMEDLAEVEEEKSMTMMKRTKTKEEVELHATNNSLVVITNISLIKLGFICYDDESIQ